MESSEIGDLRIAAISYPTLFQSEGGLQIQIRETINALQSLGVEISYIDPAKQRFSDFDLVHIFGAMNGLYRVAEFASKNGIPVVMSSLLQPHWTKSAKVSKVLDPLLQRLTHWHVKSEYHQAKTALRLSNAVIALGERERATIQSAFGISDDDLHVVPNGIPKRFFSATPAEAVARDPRAKGCVLNVATLSKHKNQLALADALSGTEHHIVLVGGAQTGDRGYVESLVARANLSYWGRVSYDDPLLTSVYAAAGVFCLPSLAEVMPLSILESLAAGTPVVCTTNHGMDLTAMRDVVVEVDPHDKAAIKRAVERFLTRPPDAARCQEAVRQYSWDSVAEQIKLVYRGVLKKKALAV